MIIYERVFTIVFKDYPQVPRTIKTKDEWAAIMWPSNLVGVQYDGITELWPQADILSIKVEPVSWIRKKEDD